MRGGRQARDSQQVVGGGDQVGVLLHPRASAVAGLRSPPMVFIQPKPSSIRLRSH
jgi:hypothetical protein